MKTLRERAEELYAAIAAETGRGSSEAQIRLIVRALMDLKKECYDIAWNMESACEGNCQTGIMAAMKIAKMGVPPSTPASQVTAGCVLEYRPMSVDDLKNQPGWESANDIPGKQICAAVVVHD